MHTSLYALPASAQRLVESRRASANLYQRVGVESQVVQADPHRMVALLFDGFMEAVAQARGALRQGQRDAKATACSRAMAILEDGLRAGLDLKAGGSLARDLDELYSYIAMRLTMANVRNDEAALDECQRLVQPLQQAWASIATDPAARR
jgi:flagellar secretion chaperone FliS